MGAASAPREPPALHAEKRLSAVLILPVTSVHRFSCSPAKSQGFAVFAARAEVRRRAAVLLRFTRPVCQEEREYGSVVHQFKQPCPRAPC